jgi:hypothetical protein
MPKTFDRSKMRILRHVRLRKRISGGPDRPRLSVFHSNSLSTTSRGRLCWHCPLRAPTFSLSSRASRLSALPYSEPSWGSVLQAQVLSMSFLTVADTPSMARLRLWQRRRAPRGWSFKGIT